MGDISRRTSSEKGLLGNKRYNINMGMICLKYRMLPTRAQETALEATLAVCREVYNSLIIERTAVYETEKKSLTYRYQQNVSLKNWKAEHAELSEIHSQVLQNVAVRVDLS
jgi:putative transposase